MKSSTSTSVLPLMQRFFIQRLMRQREASSHTIDCYRRSFTLLFRFASKRLGVPPERMEFEQIDAALITAFLDDLETSRNVSVRTRNLRLTAIHSFFRFAAFELPTHGAQIQQVLAIPGKRFTRKQVRFLNREEVDALLAAPDTGSWSGRRDHAFILTAVQTGLRVSEMTGLKRQDLVLGTGAHVQVMGKGRKFRSTPLAKPTCAVLKAWLREPQRGGGGCAVSQLPRRAVDHPRCPAPSQKTPGDSGKELPFAEGAAGHRPCPSPYRRNGHAAGRH